MSIHKFPCEAIVPHFIDDLFSGKEEYCTIPSMKEVSRDVELRQKMMAIRKSRALLDQKDKEIIDLLFLSYPSGTTLFERFYRYLWRMKYLDKLLDAEDLGFTVAKAEREVNGILRRLPGKFPIINYDSYSRKNDDTPADGGYYLVFYQVNIWGYSHVVECNIPFENIIRSHPHDREACVTVNESGARFISDPYEERC